MKKAKRKRAESVRRKVKAWVPPRWFMLWPDEHTTPRAVPWDGSAEYRDIPVIIADARYYKAARKKERKK